MLREGVTGRKSPRVYDETRRGPEDNPTVGIILCAKKDASVVRYSVLHGNEQLFASKYKLVLPTEEELRTELDREQRMLMGTAAMPSKANRKLLTLARIENP